MEEKLKKQLLVNQKQRIEFSDFEFKNDKPTKNWKEYEVNHEHSGIDI